MVRSVFQAVAVLSVALAAGADASPASNACRMVFVLEDEPALTRAMPEIARYGDTVVSVASGSVACAKPSDGVMVCRIDGPAVARADPAGRYPTGIIATGAEPIELHVYREGLVACATKAEFDRYR